MEVVRRFLSWLDSFTTYGIFVHNFVCLSSAWFEMENVGGFSTFANTFYLKFEKNPMSSYWRLPSTEWYICLQSQQHIHHLQHSWFLIGSLFYASHNILYTFPIVWKRRLTIRPVRRVFFLLKQSVTRSSRSTVFNLKIYRYFCFKLRISFIYRVARKMLVLSSNRKMKIETSSEC